MRELVKRQRSDLLSLSQDISHASTALTDTKESVRRAENQYQTLSKVSNARAQDIIQIRLREAGQNSDSSGLRGKPSLIDQEL